jgi:hypothetical protein
MLQNSLNGILVNSKGNPYLVKATKRIHASTYLSFSWFGLFTFEVVFTCMRAFTFESSSSENTISG